MKNPACSKVKPAPAPVASDNITVLVPPDGDLTLCLFKAEQMGRSVLSMTEIRQPGPTQGGWVLKLGSAVDTFKRPRKARAGETWGVFSTGGGLPWTRQPSNKFPVAPSGWPQD